MTKHYRFLGAYCTKAQYQRLMKGAPQRKSEARKGIPHIVKMKKLPRVYYV